MENKGGIGDFFQVEIVLRACLKLVNALMTDRNKEKTAPVTLNLKLTKKAGRREYTCSYTKLWTQLSRLSLRTLGLRIGLVDWCCNCNWESSSL